MTGSLELFYDVNQASLVLIPSFPMKRYKDVKTISRSVKLSQLMMAQSQRCCTELRRWSPFVLLSSVRSSALSPINHCSHEAPRSYQKSTTLSAIGAQGKEQSSRPFFCVFDQICCSLQYSERKQSVVVFHIIPTVSMNNSALHFIPHRSPLKSEWIIRAALRRFLVLLNFKKKKLKLNSNCTFS